MNRLRRRDRHRKLWLMLILWGGLALFLLASWFHRTEPGGAYEGMSSQHWLGTMASGVDLAEFLSRATLRSLLLVALVTVPVAIAGYLVGGRWALHSMHGRVSRLPPLLVLTLLGPTPILLTMTLIYCFPYPGSLPSIVFAICLAGWAPVALRVRYEVGRLLREHPCVEVARLEGATDWGLLLEELLPLAIPLLESQILITAVAAMTTEATIGYLVASIHEPSLGRILQLSHDAFVNATPPYVHGIRMAVSVAVVFLVLVGGLKLLEAWRVDVRRARSLASGPAQPLPLPAASSGWLVSVSLNGLHWPLVEHAWMALRPGTMTVLAGGSGSGKSLMLLAVANEAPVGLTISRLTFGAARGAKVLLVPQGLHENFPLTMEVERYLHCLPIPQPRIAHVLSLVGLSFDQLRTPHGRYKTFEELSGGMCQRLALGLALLQDPDILLLDEPVASLDIPNADAVGRLLRELLLSRPKLAMVVSNHCLEWTRKYADRVVVAQAGTCVWEGSTPDAFLESIGPLYAQSRIWDVTQPLTAVASGRESVPILKVESLTISHSGSLILPTTSFQVHEGEILGITGPSGVGKSTLLNALANVLPRTAQCTGAITLCGVPANRNSIQFRRAVRYGRQNPATSLNLLVPVRRILQQSISRLGLTTVKESVQLIADACRDSHFPSEMLDKLPVELSGGLQCRAGLARCFLGPVKLLLLDEPTAGLDPETAAIVLQSISDFAAHGGAVIVVSHAAEHLRYLCARTLSLSTAPS